MTEEENIIQIARTRQDELYNGIRMEWLSHSRKMDNFLNELESIQIHVEDLQRERMLESVKYILRMRSENNEGKSMPESVRNILRQRWTETHEG
jgi:hypothetical protein